MADFEPSKHRALVFILEDDKDLLNVLKQALESRPEIAVRGFRTLNEMMVDPDLILVDLFVLDIHLQDEITGFEVPDFLPTRCRFAAFLFMSGFPVNQDQYKKVSSLSLFDFIAKPFSMIHFIHRIDIMLAARIRLPADLGDRLITVWNRDRFLAIVLDQDFRIRLCNDRVARVLDIPKPRDLVGRSWLDFLPAKIGPEMKRIQKAILSGDLARYGEFENDIISASGSIYRIKWFNSPFEGGNGESLTLSVGVMADDRERKIVRLRQIYKDVLIKDRMTIRSLKPLKLPGDESCQIEGGENDTGSMETS